MLPPRLRSGTPSLERLPTTTSVTSRRRYGALLLAGMVVLLAITSILLLVDAGFHGRAYALVESIARTTGLESALANSPTAANRRTVEIAARVSAEEATRQVNVATMSLVASSLTLVETTKALARTHGVLSETSKAVSRRVAIRTAAGAARSVATLAGKAVPYLGIATLLALTAYDLADACQTVKDVNSLALAAGVEPGSEEALVCSLKVPSLDQFRAWTGGALH